MSAAEPAPKEVKGGEEDEKKEKKEEEEGEEEVDPEYKKWAAEIDALVGKDNKNLGWMPVGYLEAPDNEDEEEEWKPKYEDFNKLPLVIVNTKSLNPIMKEIEERVEKETGGTFMMWTRHSYVMHEIILEKFQLVDLLWRRKNFKRAFLVLFGTTYFFKQQDFWYCDTDAPETVKKILKDFGRLWRKVWKKTDTELGVMSKLPKIDTRKTINNLVKEMAKDARKRLRGE